MAEQKRVAYVCRDCGSPEVRVDAYVSWNARLQRNEIASEFDEQVCEGDNGCNCNGNSTKSVEISADQDCHIEPHPDGETDDQDRPIWLVVYEEETFHVPGEAAAKKVQEDWRINVGRNLSTGEAEPSRTSVSILWGLHHEVGDEPKTYTFHTAEELDAFTLGISEMDGWLAHKEVEPDFVVTQEWLDER